MLLAVAGGVAIAAYLQVGERPYYPVATVSTPGGLTYTAFSEETRGREACNEANQRFVADFRAGCADCAVTYERCESKADALKLRVAFSGPVVLSRGVSLGVAGPRELSVAACQQIVKDLAQRGVQGRCLKSGSEPDYPKK